MKAFQKRKIFIFFLISIGVSSKINAQKDSIPTYKESYVTVNLLSHINSFSPRWRVGYIKSINKNFKVGLDVGYGSKEVLFSSYKGNVGDNYKIWEIRPEFYYVKDEYSKRIKLYFSLDLFYINHKDVFFNDDYLEEESQNIISYSRIDYLRQKFGFNIKFGYIIDINDHFKLNIYSGIGLRVRNNTFDNPINPINTGPREFFVFSGNDNENNFNYKEGTVLGFNIPLGVKLFYKF